MLRQFLLRVLLQNPNLSFFGHYPNLIHLRLIYCVLFLSCRYPFTADQEIPETDWEVYLRETANAIVSQQTPQR